MSLLRPEKPLVSERPRLYHFGTGASLVVTCLIGQQLVKAVEQSTQAEFHGQDLAALVSRPHARARVGGAGDLDIGPGLPKLRPGARWPAVRAELLGQVPVDGGAGNAEGFGDLGGAFALGGGQTK